MTELESVLERLAKADGVKAAIDAHQQARGLIRSARRKSHQQIGTLAACFREAMRIWDAQKADGVPLAERLTGLRQTIASAWPQTREWKYLCQQCSDYGLTMHECSGDGACGRTKPHLPHEFGRPCWCSAGAKFREKPKPSPDDFTQAGRSKPSRVGR